MRERFIIQGLGGRRALSGSIPIRGAKNAALKAFAAALLFGDAVKIRNVPEIEDVRRIIEILSSLGAVVEKKRNDFYAATVPPQIKTTLPTPLAKRLRASIVLVGPLLSRFGRASFPHPGGCVIGPRPIDIFLDSFQKMGAQLRKHGDQYELKAADGHLHGTDIFLKRQSVTATETLMMAAVGARGKTVLKNAAREPEISALARFLNSCGAKIEGAGTPTITIVGGSPLLCGGRAYRIPPDRIEAGSFLILGALAGRDFEIKDCDPSHLEALIGALQDSGVELEISEDTIRICTNASAPSLKACGVKTSEYPGFPTDLQAPMVVYLTQTSGQALVFETIFEGRFRYVDELIQMGARIDICDPHRVIVKSTPVKLRGRRLESPDLRAGLAYIIAAIVAKGESVIHNVYNIDRGYERIEDRLQAIGVDIERIGA